MGNRPQVFVPPMSSRAFRTRTPGFLGGTGQARDAAAPGLQAAVAGPLGASTQRGQPFAKPANQASINQQAVQMRSQMQGNPNAGVAKIAARPIVNSRWTTKASRPVSAASTPVADMRGAATQMREQQQIVGQPAAMQQQIARLRGVYSGR